VFPAKRFRAAATGATILLALSACANFGGGNDAAGTGAGKPVSATTPAELDPSEAPPSQPADDGGALAPGAPAAKAEGIATTGLIGKAVPKMGNVVTDAKNWVLYRFDKDSANPPTSNCTGKCAEIWPPVLTDGNPDIQGIDPDLVGTLTRADGSTQLTIDGWAVYRYIGDTKPGQWKGQFVSGTWWVIAPDGKRNKSCLPKGTPKPVQPPADAGAEENPPAGDGGGYSY
jgi:predicted lipoprotein with Yx(FWY)xxD motif